MWLGVLTLIDFRFFQIKDGAIGGLRMIKCCSRDNPLPPMPYLQGDISRCRHCVDALS